jgi:hypothetical protein
VLKRGLDRHRQRIAELDAISRTRALSKGESFELEREILLADGKPLPHGLTRGLARHGIKRDMSRYASGPATRGSGEAETRDRGGEGPEAARSENP